VAHSDIPVRTDTVRLSLLPLPSQALLHPGYLTQVRGGSYLVTSTSGCGVSSEEYPLDPPQLLLTLASRGFFTVPRPQQSSLLWGVGIDARSLVYCFFTGSRGHLPELSVRLPPRLVSGRQIEPLLGAPGSFSSRLGGKLVIEVVSFTASHLTLVLLSVPRPAISGVL
jgi:hypothetical protein